MDWKKFLSNMVAQMLASVSSELLENLKSFAVEFRSDTRKTVNPWDNVLADLICGILGIPEEVE